MIEILAEAFGLWVLYLSSKALLPKIEYFKGFEYSYFDFVFIAEISLRIPSLLTQSSIQAIKFAKNNSLLLFIANSPQSISLFLTDFMLAKSAKELVKLVLLLTLASVFFNFQIKFVFLLNMLFLQLCFIPFFVFLSFLSALLFLKFGRGEHLLMKGFSVLAVLSGLYFPTSVFPQDLESFLRHISPLEQILSSSRHAFESRLEFDFKIVFYFVSGLVLSFVLYRKLQNYPRIKIHEFDYKL